MSRHVFPFDMLDLATAAQDDVDLTEREVTILQATTERSLSTVAIAEELGLGSNPLSVVPMLERLESLDLLNGFFAAGRATASPGEVHRRYYRSSERGRLLAASTV